MRRSLAPFSKPKSSVQSQSSAGFITIHVRVYVFGTHKGLLDVNVPSCASCYGPKAKGDGEFPSLAGQFYDCIFNKLVNWSKERGQDPKYPDTSAIMQPIAHNLIKTQIDIVAAYLNQLN